MSFKSIFSLIVIFVASTVGIMPANAQAIKIPVTPTKQQLISRFTSLGFKCEAEKPAGNGRSTSCLNKDESGQLSITTLSGRLLFVNLIYDGAFKAPSQSPGNHAVDFQTGLGQIFPKWQPGQDWLLQAQPTMVDAVNSGAVDTNTLFSLYAGSNPKQTSLSFSADVYTDSVQYTLFLINNTLIKQFKPPQLVSASSVATPEPTTTSAPAPTTPSVNVPASAAGFPHGVAAVDAYNCPPTHPIKGNANSMIYPRPGQQAYSRTKPEACYSNEPDAVTDGFRAAKR